MGREALCAQCLSVWIYTHTHIYIYFLHIYAIFTCYKTTELLGTRLRQLFVWIFFKEKTFEKYSLLMIIWGIHTFLFSLNVTWRCEGHQLWKTFHESLYFLEQTYFWEQKHNCIISVQSTKLLSELKCTLLNLMYLRNVFFKSQVTFSYTAV